MVLDDFCIVELRVIGHWVGNSNAHELLSNLNHHICDLVEIRTRSLLAVCLCNLNNLLIDRNVHVQKFNNILQVLETKIVVRYVILRDLGFICANKPINLGTPSLFPFIP